METPGLRVESHLGDLLDSFELAFREGLNIPLISEDGRWTLRNMRKILWQFDSRTHYQVAPRLHEKELGRSITVEYKLHLVQQGRQVLNFHFVVLNSIQFYTKLFYLIICSQSVTGFWDCKTKLFALLRLGGFSVFPLNKRNK